MIYIKMDFFFPRIPRTGLFSFKPVSAASNNHFFA